MTIDFIRQAKISLLLSLCTATIVTFGLSLPTQAQDDTRGHNWKIAKENVDKFFDMKDKDIANLFDYYEHKVAEYEITIDEKTELQVNKNNPFNFNEFSFLQKPSLPPTNYKTSIQEVCGSAAMQDFRTNDGHDRIWTGAKRKDEKEYWSIIKANLDKFIGMSSEEITALLGPERCSSKPWNRIDYRIGDAGLTFYLKDGKVEKLRFKSNVYIPGT